MFTSLFTDLLWFKRNLQDLVERHYCTAAPDWLDTQLQNKNMHAVFEEARSYEVR